MKFYMPTNVIMERKCIKNNSEIFSQLGHKAMLVTGKYSAKKSGAQNDVIAALLAQEIPYIIYDKVNPNPTIECVYEGAAIAKENGVDIIIAIGGGSPMDAAKAISLLAAQDIKEEDLFSGCYGDKILPMVHIPTTAGTGSEVTPYAILTNDKKQTKTSITAPILFPRVALCDPQYMVSLNQTTTINTVIDALSHAIEGILSLRANPITNVMAGESITAIVDCYKGLVEGKLSLDERSSLLYASTLAGMVIAHTGTTAVHSMGYSLTYFKDIDHGRANGLLLAEFLKVIEEEMKDQIAFILRHMGLSTVNEIKEWLESLLGEKEKITQEEVKTYAQLAIQAKNIRNCPVTISQRQIEEIYSRSLI